MKESRRRSAGLRSPDLESSTFAGGRETPHYLSSQYMDRRARPSDQPIGLVAVNSVDFLRRYFRLLDDGRVVVPLRSVADQYRIEACRITEVHAPDAAGGWFEGPVALSDSDHTAQVSFTSGTEGEPKGVRLTHRNLTNAARRISDAMLLDGSVREYVGVPVYHSFGLGRVRAVTSVGGKIFVPPRGFDLHELVNMLRAREINAISAVPSLWRVVLENRNLFESVASAVRWIEIGSQPMSAADKRALRSLFPGARILQHYGLTEASRSTFLDISTADDSALESVGSASAGVEIAISADGRIRIRGPHVAQDLIVGGRVVAATDSGGWITTSDLGQLRDGKLFFLGRADDVINLGGLKVAPEQVEQGMAARLGFREGYVVVRVPDERRGDGVLIAALATLSAGDAELRETCQQALADLGIEGGSSVHLQRFEQLPTTESGKPRRREIASRFEFERRQTPVKGSARGRSLIDRIRFRRAPTDVRSIFARHFPGRPIGAGDTFIALGGDSLTFVSMSAQLSSLLGELPEGWESMSIRHLSESLSARSGCASSWLVPLDTSSVMRAVAPLMIIVYHMGLELGGGAYLLMMVLGLNYSRLYLGELVRGKGLAHLCKGVLVNLLLPYWIIVVMYEVYRGVVSPSALLLDDNISGGATQTPFPTWFVQAAFQSILLTTLPLVFGGARRWVAQNRFRSAALFMLLGVAAWAIDPAPGVWKGNEWHLGWVYWLFAAGLLVHAAREPREQWFASVVLALAAWPLLHDQGGSRVVLMMLGPLALIWIPRIPTPRVAAPLVAALGSASIFIYMLHPVLVVQLDGMGPERYPIGVALSAAAGIGAAFVYRRMVALTPSVLSGLYRAIARRT